jgi:hypothetical protein
MELTIHIGSKKRTDEPAGSPHPALRATFSRRAKETRKASLRDFHPKENSNE